MRQVLWMVAALLAFPVADGLSIVDPENMSRAQKLQLLVRIALAYRFEAAGSVPRTSS